MSMRAGNPKVVVITGPTASGKSELAQAVCEARGGEIVSADSMQIYRGMDIGTAKVPEESRTVAYHCIDLVDPGEPFSVALYQKLARAAIEDIWSRGKLPVVCGGTGLYIQAICYDMDFPKGEQDDNPVRDRYASLAEEVGPDKLHTMLAERDPRSAELIHPNNVRRVIRAFEMLEDGTSYAEQNAQLGKLSPYYDFLEIGLSVPRDMLVTRIDERVEAMLANGLLDEVAFLLEAGFEESLTSSQAIGYKEFVPIVKYGLAVPGPEYDEAVQQVKTATRRYAKRQASWIRRDGQAIELDASSGFTQTELETCLEMIDCFLEETERGEVPV